MLVVEYWSICAPYPSPLNKYEKLHNLDFGTFSKFIYLFFPVYKLEKISGHRVILTIFFYNNHVREI